MCYHLNNILEMKKSILCTSKYTHMACFIPKFSSNRPCLI